MDVTNSLFNEAAMAAARFTNSVSTILEHSGIPLRHQPRLGSQGGSARDYWNKFRDRLAAGELIGLRDDGTLYRLHVGSWRVILANTLRDLPANNVLRSLVSQLDDLYATDPAYRTFQPLPSPSQEREAGSVFSPYELSIWAQVYRDERVVQHFLRGVPIQAQHWLLWVKGATAFEHWTTLDEAMRPGGSLAVEYGRTPQEWRHAFLRKVMERPHLRAFDDMWGR